MPAPLVDPTRQIEDARCTLLALIGFDDFAQRVYGQTLADAVTALERIQDNNDERGKAR